MECAEGRSSELGPPCAIYFFMADMLPDEVNSEQDLTACFFWQLLRLIPNSVLHI